MSDKVITLADETAADALQRALFAAWQAAEGGVIDRYLDGTPAPVQVTTRATSPLPAVVDDDGRVLVPENPLTLVIDERCAAFHGSEIFTKRAPGDKFTIAPDAVLRIAEGKEVLPIKLEDGKDAVLVNGEVHDNYVIDLSAAVPIEPSKVSIDSEILTLSRVVDNVRG